MRGYKRRRSDQSWTLEVYLGRDPVTGKKRKLTKSIRPTGSLRAQEKAADAALAQMIHEVETGSSLEPSKLTVAGYLDRWLEVTRPRVKPRTHDRYAELLRVHVTPVIGHIALAKLRPLHVEKVHARVFERGRSAQTVLHVHRVLSSALKQAVRWQLVGRNVAEAVAPPRPPKREIEALEPEHVSRLMDAIAGTDLELPVVLALGTGMRRGEILGLRWHDVDLDRGTARVSQTLQSDLTFSTPKSHRSRRALGLPGFVVEALRAQRKTQAERRLLCGSAWQDTDLVVDRGDGGPITPAVLSKRFGAVARAACLSIGFHGLRHGHASLLIASGVHLKIASERLGHASIQITADLYSHVAPALDRQAAETLDALLTPAFSEVARQERGKAAP
ncbi:MAG: site-specific integrase [Actinomycetota bacterium]